MGTLEDILIDEKVLGHHLHLVFHVFEEAAYHGRKMNHVRGLVLGDLEERESTRGEHLNMVRVETCLREHMNACMLISISCPVWGVGMLTKLRSAPWLPSRGSPSESKHESTRGFEGLHLLTIER